jgi:hypothetical protein
VIVIVDGAPARLIVTVDGTWSTTALDGVGVVVGRGVVAVLVDVVVGAAATVVVGGGAEVVVVADVVVIEGGVIVRMKEAFGVESPRESWARQLIWNRPTVSRSFG